MSNKNPQLANGEIYHVVLKTVGDTIVFNDEKDFYRGIFSIYEFNNDNPVNMWNRRKARATEKKLRGRTSQTLQERDMFVEILAFSFMPNHLHLVLKQKKDNGIIKFVQKVGTGFAVYFNKKYNRKGHLFNKFKAVHIEDESQLKNTFVYVHTNLISLIEPGWKEKGIEDSDKVINFLESNNRHSYMDYLGQKAFPSITQRDFFLEVMGGTEGCKAEVDNWIKYKRELKDFKNIVLE